MEDGEILCLKCKWKKKEKDDSLKSRDFSFYTLL